VHGTGNPADQVLPDAAENIVHSGAPYSQIAANRGGRTQWGNLPPGYRKLIPAVPRLFRFQPCRADAFRGVIAPWPESSKVERIDGPSQDRRTEGGNAKPESREIGELLESLGHNPIEDMERIGDRPGGQP
jgi:hypothetical protein